MMKRRTLVLMLLLLSGGALADDFVSQASVVDGDTLEIHGTRIRPRRKAASYAAARTVCNIVVARRQRTTLTHSLPGVRSTAHPSTSIHMAGRLRPVRLVAPISAHGLFAEASRWIGLNTRKADMVALSVTPNVPARNLERQLRRAVALSCLHPGGRKAVRLFG
jgi:hypothetical protein